jgi:mono/diheme cytochrome c family protein
MSLRQLLACSVLVSLVACDGSNGDSGDRAATILDLEGDPAAGEQVYADECSSCHGVSGEGGVGPAMSSVAGEGEAEIVEVVLEGEGDMPSFSDLPDQDIADLVAYILDTW